MLASLYGYFLVLYQLVQCNTFQTKMTKFKDYYCKLTLQVYVVPTYHKNNCTDFTAYEVPSIHLTQPVLSVADPLL